MYNVAFTGIVIVLMFHFVDLDPISKIVLQAIGVLWGSFFCSFAFVLPRLLEVARHRKSSSGRSLTFKRTVSGTKEMLVSKSNLSDTSSIAYGNALLRVVSEVDPLPQICHASSTISEERKLSSIAPFHQFLRNYQSDDESTSRNASAPFTLKSEALRSMLVTLAQYQYATIRYYLLEAFNC
jgi:hypothetical protein